MLKAFFVSDVVYVHLAQHPWTEGKQQACAFVDLGQNKNIGQIPYFLSIAIWS